MRRNHSSAVQRFIQSTLTCTCLTLIPFSGCNSNTSKNFSLSLRRDAAKSAAAAEEEIATRKQQDAALAASAAPATSGNASAVQKPAATPSRRSPLANFMAQESASTRDPFAADQSRSDSEEETTVNPKSVQTAAAVAEDTPPQRDSRLQQVSGATTNTSPERAAAAVKESPWDQLMKEYLSESDGAAAPRPEVAARQPGPEAAVAARPVAPRPDFSAGNRPFSAGSEFADQAVTAAVSEPAPERALPPWARKNSESSDRVVGPEPPKESTGAIAQVQAQETAAPTVDANTTPVRRLTRNDLLKAQTVPGSARATLPDTTEFVAQGGSSPAPWSQPTGEASATKLRVKSLMSQSHTDIVRGDWYSAYRSALLAEQEAANRKVVFESHEEHPSQLVSTIAQRLWGGNRPPAMTEQVRTGMASVQDNSDVSPAAEVNPFEARKRSSESSNQGTIVQTQATQSTGFTLNEVFNGAGSSEWVPVSQDGAFAPADSPKISPASPAPRAQISPDPARTAPTLPAARDPWTSQTETSSPVNAANHLADGNDLPVIRTRDSWRGATQTDDTEASTVVTAAAHDDADASDNPFAPADASAEEGAGRIQLASAEAAPSAMSWTNSTSAGNVVELRTAQPEMPSTTAVDSTWSAGFDSRSESPFEVATKAAPFPATSTQFDSTLALADTVIVPQVGGTALKAMAPLETAMVCTIQQPAPIAASVRPVRSSGRLSWMIGGFLMALAATIVGLRSRRTGSA